MKKILTYLALSFFIFVNSFAGSDGELNLSKKTKPVKDCFEPVNRFTFAVNMGLDKVIFKPVAKGYRVLPSPVRASISNALDNLTALVTVPNNVFISEIFIFWPNIISILMPNNGKRIIDIICNDANNPIFSGV